MISPIFSKKIDESISCGGISEKINAWVLGAMSGNVKMYKKGGEAPTTFIACQASCRSAQFNSDASKILLTDKNGNIFICDVESTAEIDKKIKAHNSGIETAKWLNESTIVSGDSDGHIKVWDIRDWHTIQKFHDQKEYVSDIAVVDDKTFGVTTADGYLSLYTTNRNKRRDFYQQADDDFVSLCYDPFCRYFVCASSKPKIYASRCPSLEFVIDSALKSRRPFVSVRCFRTNKCRIVCAAEDGKVFISDVNPMNPIYTWEAHKKELHGLELDGGLVLTWTATNEARVWDLSEKRDEEFMSARKKKRLKNKGKLVVHKKQDHFFDGLGQSDSD